MAIVNERKTTQEVDQSKIRWDIPLYLAISQWMGQTDNNLVADAFKFAGVEKTKAWLDEVSRLYPLDHDRSQRVFHSRLTNDEMKSLNNARYGVSPAPKFTVDAKKKQT